MTFHINLTPNAADDLDYFDAYEQRIIMSAIHTYLIHDAHIPTKRRKQLEANLIASWELKKDTYRIFYDIIDDTVIYSRLDIRIITISSFAEGG